MVGRRAMRSRTARRTLHISPSHHEQAGRAAPGHVAHVRPLVIDVLSAEQLRRFGLAADRITSRIDTSAIKPAAAEAPLVVRHKGFIRW